MKNQDFIQIVKNSKSMSEAASKLRLHFNTFKRKAEELNVYKPNQGGKGCNRNRNSEEKLIRILNGEFPNYPTYKLKILLLRFKYKENKCEVCKIIDWNGKKLAIELDHVDGNRNNHLFVNLRLLCPNCHSQTDTFRAKKRKGRVAQRQRQLT